MANNETFQASVVAGIETPGSEKAQKTFDALLQIVDKLEGSAKDAGKALVDAFLANKKPELLAEKIRILQRELKYLATAGKGVELFKSDQVRTILDLNLAISRASKAYDAMRQSQALSRYELGLESKTVREAASSMQILEKNLKAVDVALQNNSGNKALLEKRKLLTDNKSLLEIVIRDLKQQTEAERLQETIAKTNFEAAKRRYAEIQRITTQRKETEGSAREQTRVSNTRFDYSQQGRDYAAMQTNLRFARAQSALMPGKEDMALRRVQEQSRNDYLRQVYQDAGIKPLSTFTSTLQDGPRVKALVAEIGEIERRLIAERVKGNINLKTESSLLEEIRGKMVKIENVRHDQRLNDPERVQARRDTQAKNMLSRAHGEGGASLLAVQASLMANYSILSSTVGAMQAAVRTSVELESSFRNVQAVTATSKTEMGGLEQTIKSVAAASRFTSLEVADAALTLGQAGLSAKQVGEALQPVVMLASAAGTNIAQAVDLVTSVIGVFDKGTEDIADIANKITQASNASKISVEKMALGLQYAGNAASQIGISFEEVTAAMAAMSNAGIRSGSTLGTGLRQFLTELQKPSQEFVESLQRIGLSMSDVDVKTHGLIGVIQRLSQAGFVASDAIKAFDVRGASAFNALIANPAELERQYRLLLDTKAGVEANDIQMDSLKSQSARLTTSLGNLASSGLEPLSKMLTQVFSGLATVTQAMSEHNVVVGVAGTALASMLARGAASHLASMAAGALKLAAGAGAASTAVVALSNASKAGSLGMLASHIASSVVSMTAIAPAATAASSALAGATTASWSFVAALKGLSIVSGIGVAIAAATGAFYLYDAIANKTAHDIDELKAKTNESKGAFEQKDAVVKSLSKKIEELTYKNSSLNKTTENLTIESLELVSQFGSIGYQADKNNVSFDTMIEKLKALRTEMANVRRQNLESSLGDNEKLLDAQVRKMQGTLGKMTGKSFGSFDQVGRIGQLVNMPGTSLTGEEKAKLMLAQSQLQKGDRENMGDVSGATLIIQRIAREMSSKPGADKLQANLLKELTDNLLLLGKDITEVGNTASEIARAKATLNRDEAYKKFNESNRWGSSGGKSMTFEDSLPAVGNLAAKTSEKDPLAIFEAVKKEQGTRAKIYSERLAQIAEAEMKNEITTETASTFRAIINARAEKEKNDLLEQARATEDEAGWNYDNQKRLLKSKIAGAKQAKDKMRLKQLEEEMMTLEIDFTNRAETSPTRALRKAANIRDVTNQNIENIENRPVRYGRDVNANTQERSLRLQADSFDREADELKASTKTVSSMEELGTLLDKAVAAKVEAKRLRVEALLKKQEAEASQADFTKDSKLAQTLEMQALTDGENSKINTFATSFVELLETAMNRLDKVTTQIKDQKKLISEAKWKGEDRVFNASEELREVEIAIATGKGTRNMYSRSATKYGKGSDSATTVMGPNGVLVDMRGNGSAKTIADTDASNVTAAGVSGAIRESLYQRRARLVLEQTAIELEENEKLLEEYGDDTKGLIGKLNEAYRSARERVAAAEAKVAEAVSEIDKTKALAERDSAVKQEGELFRDLRTAKGEQRSLRKDNQDIRVRQAEQQNELPQEVNIDNTLNKLGQVWEMYEASVGRMDVIKTLADGMTGVLGSVTGSLGNAFAQIAAGTKSVKSAFKDMAVSVIQSMLNILAQALAMQAMKGLFQMMGIGMSFAGAAMGGVPSTAAAGTMNASAGTNFVPMDVAATGGYFNSEGKIERVRKMAVGGPITGGIKGRDSVPVLAMPGEFMLNTKAVEAVGTDFLHSLNQNANSVVSSSLPSKPKSEPSNDGKGVVNVWVVTPDQKPSGMGPRDVIATVSDDINRGGSIKQLIKQVQMGG